MIREGVKHAYEIGPRIFATKTFYLYFAKVAESGEWCMLQVARKREHNGGLERAAYVLDELGAASRRYDELWAPDHGGKHLHYDRLFPTKVESFLSDADGKLRINALSFTDVQDIWQLKPLSNFRIKDRVILDLKSGAWVMGRLLKLLDFTHPLGIAVRTLGPKNILLEIDEHYGIVPDWTEAFVFQNEVTPKVATGDIVRAAETVLTSCGVPDQGSPSFILEDGEEAYLAMMRRFALGKVASADEAWTVFYDTCHTALGKGFHPFTTRPLP